MSPERRYRLLLLAYPRDYRAARAGEMLDVLLAAERGSSRSGPAEALSLVGHGLVMRLSRSGLRAAPRPAVGMAGVSLLYLLAVLGAQQLTASGLRGLGLDGYPGSWRLGVLWVDPRWPVQALWVVTGLALLLGRHRPAVVAAWTAAALHLWLVLATAVTDTRLPWLGDVGPHWTATGGLPQGSLALLSVTGALMVGTPARLARTCAVVPVGSARRVVAAGLVGVVMASAAGPTAYALLGNAHPHLVEVLGGAALPLVLASAILAGDLLRVPSGAPALLVLGVLVTVPLAARWSQSGDALVAGLACCLACCLAGRALVRSAQRRLLAASDAY